VCSSFAQENLTASEVTEFTLTICAKEYEFRYTIKRSGDAVAGFATTPFSALKLDEKQTREIWALVDQLDDVLTNQSKSRYRNTRQQDAVDYLIEFRSKDKFKSLITNSRENEKEAPKPLRSLVGLCHGLVKW